MKVVRATLSAFVILALAGCALNQVRTDYDRNVTFDRSYGYRPFYGHHGFGHRGFGHGHFGHGFGPY